MSSVLPHTPAWLQYPSWLDYPETMALPQPREAYEIRQIEGYRWMLTERATGAHVYHGIGPIQIVDQPIPF